MGLKLCFGFSCDFAFLEKCTVTVSRMTLLLLDSHYVLNWIKKMKKHTETHTQNVHKCKNSDKYTYKHKHIGRVKIENFLL